MKIWIASIAAAAGFAVSAAQAQVSAPADAPAGSNGVCKDGTYSTNPTKSGACSGHKGVKSWFGPTAAKPVAADAAAPAPPAAPVAAAAPAPAVAVAPTPAAAPAPAPVAKPTKASTAMPTTPAAGGGAGQVWVNASSKVYHCPGTKYYGLTKNGSYMTEDAAKAAGNHANHGKACTQ